MFVDNLSEELKNASSVVLLDHTGLTVKNQQELKKRLKKADAKMFIAKNTLFKIAGKKAKLSPDLISDSVLAGPTAFVLGEKDPISPIQIIYKFAKEFEVPNFKVALVEGFFQEKQSLEKLAQLPSKEVLFAQVVGAIASPMYEVIGVLRAKMQELVNILNVKVQEAKV